MRKLHYSKKIASFIGATLVLMFLTQVGFA